MPNALKTHGVFDNKTFSDWGICKVFFADLQNGRQFALGIYPQRKILGLLMTQCFSLRIMLTKSWQKVSPKGEPCFRIVRNNPTPKGVDFGFGLWSFGSSSADELDTTSTPLKGNQPENLP